MRSALEARMSDLVGRPYARRALRRAVDIDCEVISPRDDQPSSYRAVDLSPYGVRLSGAEALAIGQDDELVVTFRPPREEAPELTVFARVARKSEDQVALAFRALSADEQAVLESHLHGLPPPLPRCQPS
jgi:hypothetical protein